MMFCASPGYTLVGADYSQQEPRLLTAYSMDKKLLEAYNNNKDMYATLGTGVYNNDYWDNMEHHEDGSPNVEGKLRRKKMKTLLLGMMYGMGPALLANNMNVTLQEANEIIDNFKTGFPEVQKWMEETEEEASKTGYVEDFWGRRRRLDDLLLDEYSFEFVGKDFNPLLESSGAFYDDAIIKKYKRKLHEIDTHGYDSKSHKFNGRKTVDEYENLKTEALKNDNLKITKNGGFISRAKRQCVNARIQGGSATMTKKAMIAIAEDDIMKQYDFKLLIGVHDELIGECKSEFKNECAERLTYLMKSCVPELNVPFKCDPTIEQHWNEEEYSAGLKNEYAKNPDIEALYKNHIECTKEQIDEMLK